MTKIPRRLRNEFIAQMRSSGCTFREIANRCGVSPQIIARCYPDAKANHEGLVTTDKARQAVDLTAGRFCRIAFELGLSPVMGRLGGGRLLWVKRSVAAVSEGVKCRICGAPLPRGRRLHCSPSCLREGRRLAKLPSQRSEGGSVPTGYNAGGAPDRAISTENQKLLHLSWK